MKQLFNSIMNYNMEGQGEQDDLVQRLNNHIRDGIDATHTNDDELKAKAIDDIKTLIQQGVDVNARENPTRLTALQQAIDENFIEARPILIEAGGDVNLGVFGDLTDVGEFMPEETPLSLAIIQHHVDAVRILIDNSVDIHKPIHMDQTAIHIAASRRSLRGDPEDREQNIIDIVNLLIMNGADLNKPSLSGATPLSNAVENGNEKVVDSLIEGGADVNIIIRVNREDPQLQRVSHRARRRIRRDMDQLDGQTLIHLAITNRVDRDIKRSHSRKERLRKRAMTRLLRDDGRNLRRLGARRREHDRHAAARDTGDELHPEDISDYELGPNTYILKRLIEAGAGVNQPNLDGETPLHTAVLELKANPYRNMIPFVNALVNADADLNIKDNQGETPLHHAVAGDYSSRIELVNLLIMNGADLNIPNNEMKHHFFLHYKLDNLATVGGEGRLETRRLRMRYVNLSEDPDSEELIFMLLDDENIVVDDKSKALLIDKWETICKDWPEQSVFRLQELILEKIPQDIEECRNRFPNFPVKPALERGRLDEADFSGGGGGGEGEGEDSVFEYNYGFQQGVKYALEYLSK